MNGLLAGKNPPFHRDCLERHQIKPNAPKRSKGGSLGGSCNNLCGQCEITMGCFFDEALEGAAWFELTIVLIPRAQRGIS